ncbi:MAG TPA: nuclease [Dialister sp.]|nr:nuclease [Dialister sp.]
MEDRPSIDDMSLAGRNAAYDAAAKKLLSSKKILAWILKYCVEEFRDSDIADIRDRYILGKPEVAQIPVAPDKTNAISYIQGERTEDKTLTEGAVTFDIRFRALTPAKDAIELIINVEAQQSSHVGYPLIKRALYYCSRLISSQYQVDFNKSKYGDIKKVYSIWLCMDTKDEESSITQYQMQETCLWKEKHEEKANYDLMRAIMVYISQNQKDFGNRLMGLLYTLFKGNGNAVAKKEVLRNVYHVDLDADEMKEMDDMCNLSTGIYNHGRLDGRAEGRVEGRAEGRIEGREEGRVEGRVEEGKKIIIRLLQNHMSVEFIAENTDRPVEYIRQIAKEQNLPC